MTEGFEVGRGGPEDEFSEEQRHEMVAAQLRGEAAAAGQGSEAVVAAVGHELREAGLEPDEEVLHRRYEETDPDIAVIQAVPQGDAADLPAGAPPGRGADEGGTPVSDGSITAVLDPSTDPDTLAPADRGADQDGGAAT